MKELTTRNYHVFVTITDTNTTDTKDIEINPYFCTYEEGYGNRTYLWWDHYQGFDLRYDSDYNTEHEIAYLADFMERRWSGKNGAWKLVSMTITRLIGEEE